MSTGSSYITVTVGRLPGTIQEVALDGGRTVQDAFTAAGIDHRVAMAEGYQVRVNFSEAPLGANLQQGDRVLLVRKSTSN